MILLCLATLIVKLMEVTDFTLTRIIASNTSNAQTDKPFAAHAEKKMDNNCTMTHQKNGATGGTKLTVTSDQNVTKMIKIAKIPIILPLQNQPNVTSDQNVTKMIKIAKIPIILPLQN